MVWHIAQQWTHNKKIRQKLGTIYWTYDHQDTRKPCLILVPPSAVGSAANNKTKKKAKHSKPSKFRIRVLLNMESLDWIPLLRLVPNRCNLGWSNTNTTTTIEGSPMYNHALLEDAYHTSFLPSSSTSESRRKPPNSQRQEDESDCSSEDDEEDEEDEHYPHWEDAVILAKIWCLQRGLLRAHDGFTTDHLALLILYLYRTRQANARMAPLQVLAALFKCLGETMWFDNNNNNNNNSQEQSNSLGTKQPRRNKNKRAVLVLPSPGRNEAQTIAHSSVAKLYAKQTKESPLSENDPKTLMELYQKVSPGPVLLDPSLRFNYLQRISPSFMALVQREASKSLHYLHSPATIRMSMTKNGEEAPVAAADKPFAALFMSPARFWDRHDLYFQMPLSHFRKDPVTETCYGLYSPARRADIGEYEALARAVMSVLEAALGDRVTSIQMISNGNGLLNQQQTGVVEASGQSSFLDSDQLPLYQVQKDQSVATKASARVSPRGDGNIVLGISLNADTCHRIVDRGPPADESASIQQFLDLWGNKAELRRFKDGAIVQAVVWNTTKNEPDMANLVRYQNEDSMQGGIVERIVSCMLHRHFISSKKVASGETSVIMSPLRDMTSIIDGVVMGSSTGKDVDSPSPWFANPTLAHRNIMKSFEELAGFLREHSLPSLPVPGTLEEKASRLGMPLIIDAVEPISPCLRYSEIFPPLPHPFLGGAGVKGMKKTSGAIGSEPVCIQIRFGMSSKWPTDLKAIGAAKTAMLIQLANGIEAMKETSRGECDGFAGPITVTPNYVDVGFRGYMFRIRVRADPEIRLLRSLLKPSVEAAALLRDLTRENIVSATHHAMIHGIHTKHASAGGVVRMATRWVAGHMLSGLIPLEAIELLVARVYTDRNSPLEAPASVAAGFLRFLHLLESHDWAR